MKCSRLLWLVRELAIDDPPAGSATVVTGSYCRDDWLGVLAVLRSVGTPDEPVASTMDTAFLTACRELVS